MIRPAPFGKKQRGLSSTFSSQFEMTSATGVTLLGLHLFVTRLKILG